MEEMEERNGKAAATFTRERERGKSEK